MANPPLPLGGFGKESLKSLLDRAKGEDLGIWIEGEGSTHAFEQNIQRVRAIYPGVYDDIMFCMTSRPDVVFLVKKSVELSD